MAGFVLPESRILRIRHFNDFNDLPLQIFLQSNCKLKGLSNKSQRRKRCSKKNKAKSAARLIIERALSATDFLKGIVMLAECSEILQEGRLRTTSVCHRHWTCRTQRGLSRPTAQLGARCRVVGLDAGALDRPPLNPSWSGRLSHACSQRQVACCLAV